MFRTRIFWAIVLGVVTSVLIFEARTNLAFGEVGGKVLAGLVAPGARLVFAVNKPGTLLEGSTRFWSGLAIACNFLIYLFFWYACIWIVGYLRERRNPYEREATLVPPSFR